MPPIRIILGTICFVIGLSGVIRVVGELLKRVAYGEPISGSGAAMALVMCVGVFVVGQLLLGSSKAPSVVVVWSLIAFVGLGIAAVPLRHTPLSQWAAVDVILFASGAIVLACALGWARRFTRTVTT